MVGRVVLVSHAWVGWIALRHFYGEEVQTSSPLGVVLAKLEGHQRQTLVSSRRLSKW